MALRVRKTARQLSPKEQLLERAGLLPRGFSTRAGLRRQVAKLSLAEVRTLVSVKRKTGYRGNLVVKGFFF